MSTPRPFNAIAAAEFQFADDVDRPEACFLARGMQTRAGARVGKLTYDRLRERNRSVVDRLLVKIDRCHVIALF